MNKTIEHQPRERAVLCRRCMRRDTWAVDAVCDTCRDAEQFDCSYCRDEHVVEERVYGRLAVEATRVIRCPRCRNGKTVATS
jgi:hypothetical protein